MIVHALSIIFRLMLALCVGVGVVCMFAKAFEAAICALLLAILMQLIAAEIDR